MSQIDHKECYGTMFPDSLHFAANKPIRGKVFRYELDSVDGVVSTRSDRSADADIEQWDDCLACPEFEHCYKLCLGKLTLQAAIATE